MARYPQTILVSCVIPWDENENLLEDVFRREVRHLVASGFDHLYVFGTAGEGYAVDTARFRRIVEVFSEETGKDGIFPQVGAIGLSTANVIERLGFAYAAGFRVFQVSLPCWGALNDRELLRFFEDVCGRFPDCRFLHYNLPRARRVLTAADYRRIAGRVPNLAATKNTGVTVNEARALMNTVPELQHFFGEAMFPAGCLYGECSLLSSFGVVLPSKTRELFEYGRSGQIEKLFRFHKEYMSVVDDVIAPLFRRQLIDGACDKVLARLGGCEMPLRLLSPYESFDEETCAECRRLLAAHSDWVG